MAALIGEFNRRQQGLYFYNPRADVIAVLRGACGEDFQHVSTEEELSYLLYSSGGKKLNSTNFCSKVVLLRLNLTNERKLTLKFVSSF